MKHHDTPSFPFVDALSFEFESAIGTTDATPMTMQVSESPFQSVYELESTERMVSAELDSRTELLNEMYDEEFNYAIHEFADHVADLHELQFEQQTTSHSLPTSTRVQQLYEHCAPLVRETELFFDALDRELTQQSDDEFEANELDGYEPGAQTLISTELDDFIDQYQPQQPLAPEFENLWGWAKKKAKQALRAAKKKAKQAARYAKKKAKSVLKRLAKAALSKLGKYAKGWFKRIVQFAINKLPKKYQPIAKLAAQKLGIKVEDEAALPQDNVSNSTAQVGELQYEFNTVAADLMLAEDEAEQDRILAAAMVDDGDADAPSLAQHQQARAQFKEGLLTLGEAEEPTQLVENFIPAILPMVKLGLKFYGRPKLIRFIAGYVARYLKKFVPRQYLKPLSQAVVDAGLRLINLEATEENVQDVALDAVVDTVEETVQRIAGLPEHLLDNEAFLESFVLEAFEASATSNLPLILPDKVYQERPDLRESMFFNGVWAKQPLRGHKLYKKYTHVFNTEITPHIANSIQTWRGTPLGTILRNRYGLRNNGRVKGRVHIYEATPGTWLSRIAKHETQVPGLGTTSRNAWAKLMPLTEQAAAVLLGEPRLGRDMPTRYLVDPLTIGVGQRFYYLEFPTEQLAPTALSTSTMVAYCCNAHVVLDFAQSTLSTSIFLSEAEARQIALMLRQQMAAGAVMTVLNRAIQHGMGCAFGAGLQHQVKVIHGGLGPQTVATAALLWLPAQLLLQLQARLIQWQTAHVGRYLEEQPHAFVTAVDDPAHGVTLQTTLRNPPGFSEMGGFLGGASVSLSALQIADRLPQANVEIRAGYAHG